MMLEAITYFAGPFLAAVAVVLGAVGMFLRLVAENWAERAWARGLIVLASFAFGLAVIIGPLAASAGR
jgi:hypothetical protein